ncbi:MAG: tRNA 2-thiouridine(34) synthase MnmA [bacterium]
MLKIQEDFKKEYEKLLSKIEEEFCKISINRNATVAVGLSGGVDSSATLAILKELGFNTIAITMKIWNPKYDKLYEKYENHNNPKIHGCFGPEEIEDIQDASMVSKILKTPFFVIDLTKEYEETILQYFKNQYIEGKTPNPCVICNWKMKFESLIQKALSSNLKFDYFATGHYVKRIIYENIPTLAQAEYLKKDQTYYLSYLNRYHIEKSLFPLGYVPSKETTRQIAKIYNLPTYNKPDSQNFISIKYTEIFKNEKIENGVIIDKNKKILGQHKGLHFYTIGQRKGLNISSNKPLYVINIDKESNTITVGEKEDLYQKKLIAINPNWIVPPPKNAKAKIRYTHEPAECEIKTFEDCLEVEFKEKQMAITPGQIISFYKDQILLGAATIHKVIIE